MFYGSGLVDNYHTNLCIFNVYCIYDLLDKILKNITIDLFVHLKSFRVQYHRSYEDYENFTKNC